MTRKFIPFFVAAVTTFSLSAGAAPSTPNDAQLNRNEAKAMLHKLSQLSESQFSSSLIGLAQTAKANGNQIEASVYETMVNNPLAYIDFIESVQYELENQSENGIYFLYYLVKGDWCYADDIKCGVKAFILTILTFDGKDINRNEADQS